MSVLRGPRVEAAPGFEEFVAERVGPMLGLARVLVRHEQQAEDLVQEVLATALVRWERVSAADDPVAYTNRMLVNAASSWRRRPSRRESAAVLEDDRPVVDATESTDARLALVAALQTLSARHRAVLALRYLEDWPDDDIADALGVTPSTVRSSAKRGLAALRTSGALDAYGTSAGSCAVERGAGAGDTPSEAAPAPRSAEDPRSVPPTVQSSTHRSRDYLTSSPVNLTLDRWDGHQPGAGATRYGPRGWPLA